MKGAICADLREEAALRKYCTRECVDRYLPALSSAKKVICKRTKRRHESDVCSKWGDLQ